MVVWGANVMVVMAKLGLCKGIQLWLSLCEGIHYSCQGRGLVLWL